MGTILDMFQENENKKKKLRSISK